MIRNYFKIAWRSLWKNKMTSFISLSGLVLGITCFMIMATYIFNELRFDRFNEKVDRIVYVNYNYQSPSDAEPTHTANTPTAVVPVAKRSFSEVENAARVYNYENREIQVENKNFTEKNMVLADKALLDIFSFNFIAGDPQKALDNPNMLVITQTTALKYFGKGKALNQNILINGEIWKVTGIIEDHPPYSTLNFDLVGSYSSISRSKTEVWNSANDSSFLLLKSVDQLEAVQQKFNAYIKEQFPTDFEAGYKFWFDLVPLTKLHLSSTASGNLVTYLYILGVIALLLLIIACINFTNLMTAKSSERLREIGVRKVFGAERKNLIFQFLAESAIVSFLAMCIGLGFAYLLVPAFNSVTGLTISITSWNLSYFLITCTVLFVFITLLAGIWPALVLSGFKPVAALKNTSNTIGGTSLLRKGLLVFQFMISIAFIIATLIATKQLEFIRKTDTGLDRSNIVVLNTNTMKTEQIGSFKAALLNKPNLINVTATSYSPVDIKGGYSIKVDEKMDANGMSITAAPVDKDFLTTLDIRLIAGQNFTDTDEKRVKLPDDQRQYAFMLNKKAIEAIGFSPEEAIGKGVNLNGRQGRIKGVLENFNFASLHERITPVVLFTEYEWFGKMLIKTSGNTSEALAAIDQTWKEFYPNRSFDYQFLDSEYNALYQTEQRTATILNILSTITILVACLGLFGLVTFTAAQRKKEIGIRKVLGASTAYLTALLSYDFIKLVALAIVIAIPLAWYTTDLWLQDFAYKINTPYVSYIIAAAAAFVIAGVTVSFQAIKAAIANPVKSLRTE
ncbi:ABC transporter permease [Autumnicola musiva]|uniref:FtsX-like permease family protein n=1 Tax=Autumnicola musiva TaxID=3075589 RepID=A0ABU3DAR8_9FLAO|nr:FtsX-like permease family protein [Zunongwangia sp. F117]MDT0678609.1 FtsX-like permease family protein [Zunongwangia sp. F117]